MRGLVGGEGRSGGYLFSRPIGGRKKKIYGEEKLVSEREGEGKEEARDEMEIGGWPW